MMGFFRFDNDRRILRNSVAWMRRNGVLPAEKDRVARKAYAAGRAERTKQK